MFAVLARVVAAHPWRVVVVWAIAVGAIIVFAPNLSDHTTGNQQDFLPSSFESVDAQNIGNEYFPATAGATGTLVVSRTDGGQLSPADQQTALGLATTLQNDKIPGVTTVTAGPQSVAPDDEVVALQVAFDGQPGDPDVDAAVPAVRDAASSALTNTDLTSGLTGNAAILVDSNNAYNDAERIITIATVIVILTTLGILFRSPLIAVLPVIVIAVVFLTVRGLTAWATQIFDFEVSTTLDAILVVVLFGVGTDYTVFLLFRYREHLRDGEERLDALVGATSAVGRVIASSALTVIGAFAALFLARLGSLNSLAPGLIIAVAVMLITALTLIPAVIAIGSKVMFWPVGPGHEPQRSVFAALGRGVAHRPAITAVLIGALLIVLAVFSSGYKATYNTLGEMPSDTPSQVAFDTLAASMPPGDLSPTQVYVKSSGPIPQNELATLTTNLEGVPGVAAVTPPRISGDGTAAVVNVVLDTSPFSTQALDTIDDSLRPVAHSSVPGAVVAVGGQTATLADVRSQLHSDTRHVFPTAVIIVWVILGALLLAVLAPANLLVSVFVTFAATLGALVIVFQHILDYSGIDFSTPIVLYLFVVAIGTDYNILMAERVREEFVAGKAPPDAARIAITRNGQTAAAAGVILGLTFASLTLTGLKNLEELGAGVAIGVILASCVMAPMLVPSLSVLQRGAFWWPTRPAAVRATSDARPARDRSVQNDGPD
ncbi:MMPL family transporter [Gordonia rhizosphera]|uniref:SSD domain-containing protein n=1 Tax=Gordonia rhizosphera NBRC 16068 TaxID=1108045 RepID=K6V8A8_9ACTN|nr:MMPL family transporter [Gordonia rhizosphera]GAB92453.1 hypothetical protein GORHZ_180_00120 [Gordonia rhizosphera NBRC 16068]